MTPAKRITDPTFVYVSSAHTDIRKTFEYVPSDKTDIRKLFDRVRSEQAQAQKGADVRGFDVLNALDRELTLLREVKT